MKTLGIIGSGQLGRMLAIAALPLGVQCRFLTQGDDDAVAAFAQRVRPGDGPLGEPAFTSGLDALTTEIENVSAATLGGLGTRIPLWPPVAAIECKRDRREERRLLARLGLPQGRWAATPDAEDAPQSLRDAPTHAPDPAASHPSSTTATAQVTSAQATSEQVPSTHPRAVHAHLAAAAQEVGYPCRVKAATGGYDGRGQWRLTGPEDIARVDCAAAPFVVEAEIAFDEEFSLVGVFAGDGSAPRCWTPAVNWHTNGILRRSDVATDRVPLALQLVAERCLATLGHALGYRGVLALELYRVGEQLLINEFAPRVHNSGHWTIEGAACSQFENHVRAVLGMPLGDTALRAPCVSWNVVGQWPDRAALLRVPGLHVHDYAKAPRPGRKLGHLTLWDAHPDDGRARAVESLLAGMFDG